MRVRIWQEFSSNNSARFTVVGVFESAEKAQQAADKLMEMVRTILDWYQRPENTDALTEWRDSGGAPPSLPELQFAEKYRVEWSLQSLDWLWLDNDDQGPVRTFEHLVFIDGTESWLGSKPADALIEKLGGKALVDGSIVVNEFGDTEIDGQVNLDLTCLAPTEAEARAILDEITSYLEAVKQDRGRLFATPWRSQDPWRNSTFEGNVRRDGRKLVVENGSFFHIGSGFPDMINYLKHKGCTNIQYTLTEMRRGTEDDWDDEENE